MKRLTRKQRAKVNNRARQIIARARLEQAARDRHDHYEMAKAEGIRIGKAQAETEFKVTKQAIEVKEHILRAMAQMMDAAAHLVDNLHSVI